MISTPYNAHELSRHHLIPDSNEASEISAFLKSESLRHLVTSGLATLGLIRPSLASEVNIEGLNDQEAADIVEENISRLGIAAKFSFRFNEVAIDRFYDGPPKYESMLPAPPVRPGPHANRWEEFKDMMTSGPTTALLLYGTDAIREWRSHLGHWNITKFRDPETIRGKYGVDNYNNLVHGSDSIAAVIRETGIIAQILENEYDGRGR